MDESPAGSAEGAGDDRRRIAVAGIVGNVLEWYDFVLYGYLATVFADQFFPSTDKFASLISAYAVFAIGFLARPLGGVIYGHIGDRFGRRRLLTLSVVMMGLPTFLLGLLPTYASVGLLAPVLLVALRFVQGISAGGEFSGSIIFLVEHAPANRRGVYGSLSNFGAMLGGLAGAGVASLVAAVLPEAAVEAWGWRLPFLSGIVITGAGLWLRLGIAESPEFLKLSASGTLAKSPVPAALRERRKEIVVTAGLNWAIAAGYYIVFVWLASDLIGFSLETALLLSTAALMLGTVLVPVAGMLADRFGPRRLLAAAGLLTVFAATPLLSLAGSGPLAAAVAAQLALAAIMAIYLGTMPAVFVSLNAARLRCSSLSIGYNLATAIFGGTAPLIATTLVSVTGWQASPGLYLAFSALAGLALLGFVPRRQYDDHRFN
jgi:MHS family proline/betaine transporter-like MFS transporter